MELAGQMSEWRKLQLLTPVAKLASSRVVIVLANRMGWELHQVDVKGAYLNGELQPDEVLYMRHPPGYRKDKSGHVLRLLKSLYGLKQAGRCWYQKFVSIFNALGFNALTHPIIVYLQTSKGFYVIPGPHTHLDNTQTHMAQVVPPGPNPKYEARYVPIASLIHDSCHKHPVPSMYQD